MPRWLSLPWPMWLILAALAWMTGVVVTSPVPVMLDAVLHDDSFYYLATAENLAHGYGSTFDRVNYTNGYHPLWFLVVAALSMAGVGHDALVPVAISVQAGFVAIGVVVLYRFLISQAIAPVPAAVAIGVVYTVVVPMLAWNLLEAGLSVLTSALVLVMLDRLCDRGVSPWLLGVTVSVAFLARTDHGLYIPIAGLILLLREWRRGLPAAAKQALAFAIPVAGLVGGYLLFNLLTTGHVMPVSGRVKAHWATTSWSWAHVWSDLAQLDVRQSWKLAVLGGVVLLIRDVRRRQLSGITAYCLGATAMFLYYLLSHPQGSIGSFWYFVPLYAVLCCLLAMAMQELIQVAGRYQSLLVNTMAAGLVVVVALRLWTVYDYRMRPEGERAAYYRVAEVLSELRQGRHVRVAAWDAGILGFYAGPVTNLDGLINSAEYFDEYYSKDREIDYINEHGFDYIVCYESYLHRPGGAPARLLDTYRVVFSGWEWVILERLETQRSVSLLY